MNNSYHKGVNVGSSSIIIIFVTLCLISFAALSIVSANADYKLSKKVADRTTAYYNACNDAELRLQSIDASLKDLYESGISKADYLEQTGTEIEFYVPINSLQSLLVTIEPLYPKQNGLPFYRVDNWAIVTTGTLEYDESLHVITRDDLE